MAKENDSIFFLVLALFLGSGIFTILFGVIYKGGNLLEDLSKSFTTKEKVSSIKELPKKSSYEKSSRPFYIRSPYENYKNPEKECNYRNANFKDAYLESKRFCVNYIDGSIFGVSKDERIEKIGNLYSVKRYQGSFSTTVYFFEYKIEGDQLVRYQCEVKYNSCNGKSSRGVYGTKRFWVIKKENSH